MSFTEDKSNQMNQKKHYTDNVTREKDKYCMKRSYGECIFQSVYLTCKGNVLTPKSGGAIWWSRWV